MPFLNSISKLQNWMWFFHCRLHLKLWMVLSRAPCLVHRAFWILAIGFKRQLSCCELAAELQGELEGTVKRKLKMWLVGMWGLPKATPHRRKSDPNANRLYRQRTDGDGRILYRRKYTSYSIIWCKYVLHLHFKHQNLQR